ncbi:MAG: hypothetical protein ACOX6T_17345 [Myxococcales bacterium]|jgi:hypothetical protein
MSKVRRTAVLEEKQVARAATSREVDGLWAIAMLRIAMELKRPGAPGLPEIIDGVVERMGIPKAEFERFLASEIGHLQEEAESRGYTR